jgi:hypothetical protein
MSNSSNKNKSEFINNLFKRLNNPNANISGMKTTPEVEKLKRLEQFKNEMANNSRYMSQIMASDITIDEKVKKYMDNVQKMNDKFPEFVNQDKMTKSEKETMEKRIREMLEEMDKNKKKASEINNTQSILEDSSVSFDDKLNNELNKIIEGYNIEKLLNLTNMINDIEDTITETIKRAKSDLEDIKKFKIGLLKKYNEFESSIKKDEIHEHQDKFMRTFKSVVNDINETEVKNKWIIFKYKENMIFDVDKNYNTMSYGKIGIYCLDLSSVRNSDKRAYYDTKAVVHVYFYETGSTGRKVRVNIEYNPMEIIIGDKPFNKKVDIENEIDIVNNVKPNSTPVVVMYMPE